MAFWIRNTTGGNVTVDDLGCTLAAAEERDLHEHFLFDSLQTSTDLGENLTTGDLVRLDGPGGSTIPVAEAFDDATSAHQLGGDAHTTTALAELNALVSDATLDDSSGTRVPTTHASSHQNGGVDEISVSGLSGTLADPQAPSTHAASHQNDGSDELNVAGMSGVLADAQTPDTHASVHESGGSDEVAHQSINGSGTNTHAQLDNHVGSTSNPHTVTASQVGNTTAQWNANQLTGSSVSTDAPSNGDLLTWSGTEWEPDSLTIGADYFDGYDAAGGTSLGVSWVDVPVATERKKTSAFTHIATAPAEVVIAQAGTYVVIGRITVDQTAGNSRSEAEMQLALDSGSGYNDLPGSIGRLYSRQTTQGEATAVTMAVIDFSVGHKIKLQGRVASGSGTISLLDEGSSLILFSTNGPKGTTGATGSGSNLTIQDEGTNVPNTPHSTLDFAGAGVTVTDSGSGKALVTIAGASASTFGAEFANSESLALSTTSGTTWVEKVRLNVTSIPAGTYRVGWSYEWSLSSAANDFRCRVQVDDSTLLLEQQQEAKDTGTDQRYPAGGFGNLTLTAGDHHIDMDYSSSATSTARIRNARLEFWRVS